MGLTRKKSPENGKAESSSVKSLKLVSAKKEANLGHPDITTLSQSSETEAIRETGNTKKLPKDINTPKTLKKNRTSIREKHLINKINFLNFQDLPLKLHFRNKKSGMNYSAKAYPAPCTGSKVYCTWHRPEDKSMLSKTTSFSHMEIRTENFFFTAEPDMVSFDHKGITLKLNEKCHQWHEDDISIPAREGIKIRLAQNSALFEGFLTDFTAGKLGAKISFKPPQTFHWIDDNLTANLTLFEDDKNYYSGECTIERLANRLNESEIVLSPINLGVRRFKPTKYRSQRQELVPAPNIAFTHPLTGKHVSLNVMDISGSGLSVEDDANLPVLLPGMLIPELSIQFSHSSAISCQAQVVYSSETSEDGAGRKIRSGISILDINFKDFITLSSLLHQATDRHSYVCNRVNTDALWGFFFETGFIYPGKYEHFQRNKREIKKTYEKLYSHSPSIAGHFTYQDKGEILGHMSMLRFYDKSWMIHHHAARKTSLVKAGVAVLKQISRFSYDSHRYHSSHMNFLFCYYRPDNGFPSFVFGGAVNSINNPEKCSEDTFAYLHVTGATEKHSFPGRNWKLENADHKDLSELTHRYLMLSGGLMIRALDLDPEFDGKSNLEQEYQKHGFSKEKEVLALKKSGELKAVIIINKTDTGLNMSDLTSCIKVLVVDGEGLTKDVISSVTSKLASSFPAEEVPLLVYPAEHAETAGLAIEKKYNLWIMNNHHSDKYFKHLDNLFSEHLQQSV